MSKVIMMTPDKLNDNGYYRIDPMNTHVFPIKIEMFGSMELTTCHVYTNSQDLTIRVWISDTPITMATANYDTTLDRRPDRYTFYDDLIAEPGQLKLSSSKEYYINVHNKQNSLNGYQLEIDFG